MAKSKATAASPQDTLRRILDKHDDDTRYSHILGEGKAVDRFYTPKHFYSTGLRLLDTILGGRGAERGGFGSGRITEIYGPERTGKSELLQKICERFLTQYEDGICLVFDQEQAFDEKKLASVPIFSCGRMSIMWSRTAESLFRSIEKMVTEIHESGETTPILIGIDSLAAMETDEEADKTLEEHTMMGIARILSRAMKKIRNPLTMSNAHLVVLNQIRDKPNAMAGVEPESPGGRALKFAADYRIRTMNKGQFRFKADSGKGADKAAPDGLLVGFKTIKNKLDMPLRVVEIPLLFRGTGGERSGFSDMWSVFYQLKRSKLLKVSGGRYTLDGLGETFDMAQWPEFWNSDVVMPVIDAALVKWQNRTMQREGAVADDDENGD